jgi:serine/threonine-protein kinase RsbW
VDPARIALAPALSEVARLNAWLGEVAAEAEAPPAVVADMKLCLNEAVANVISYAFDGVAEPACELVLRAEGGGLVAELADNGVPVRSHRRRGGAAAGGSLDAAGIGGFGIKLMRETAAELSYRRAAGWNRLRIVCR